MTKEEKDLKTAQDAARKAERALDAVKDQIAECRGQKRKLFDKALQDEIDFQFGPALKAATEEAGKANVRLREAADAAAAVAKTPWPVGARFVEWKRGGLSGGGPWYITGTIGVFEVWSSASAKPGNIGSYRVPEIGRYVIGAKKKTASRPGGGFRKG